MVSNIQKTNRYYSEIYAKWGAFAVQPYSWSIFYDRDQDMSLKACGGFILDMSLKLLLSPILMPITLMTCALAFMTTLIAGICHLLTLIGALILSDTSAEYQRA